MLGSGEAEWLGDLEEEEGPPGSSPAAIAELLASQEKPKKPTRYNVAEADFWRTRHIPPGSVISFVDPEHRESAPPLAAVLVTETVSRQSGMWLTVKSLGAETAEEKKKVDGYFKGSRKKVHICCLGPDGICPMDDEDALHLQRFHWFPPGDFTAEWLTAAAKKLVKKGAEKELESGRDPLFPTEDRGAEEVPGGPSTIEQRLSALRGPGRRVSFAAHPTVVSASRQAEGREAAKDGAGGGHRALAPVVAPPLGKVKDEEPQWISDSEQSTEAAKKTKKRSLAMTLAKAAKLRNAQEEKEEKRKKSRSRSPGKKKKKRKKKSSDSEESADSAGHSSSSEASLMAPLKKRSRKSPGSVYRMLEQTAVERLSADGVVEEGYEAAGLRGQRPKMLTFFQLVLRPALDARSRDCKELSLLSRSLDLLREGRLAELADVLASRLIAVDTAGRQGWHVARHLEVYGEEEENSAPPHVLLAAQKHARQVDKAGGKGSWSPAAAQWSSYEQRPKGKGKAKGKTKKGKGKGKNWKGGWSPWPQEGKDKPSDPKKKEAEA